MKIGSIIRVADNSGACFLRIIKILKSPPRATLKLGSIILGSVTRTHERKKFNVSKGRIVRGVCIRIAGICSRKQGQKFQCQSAGVAIIKKSGIFRGTRIYGPITKELRELGWINLISASTKTL